MKNKKCSKCLELKSTDQFHKRGNRWKSHCKACIKAKYYEDPQTQIDRSRRAKQADPARYKELGRLYRERNKDRRNKQARDRRQNDPEYRIRHNLRMRMNRAIKDIAKSDHTIDILGCTIEEFRSYLEDLFTDGMSWANYGRDGWHIDHIKPCAAFDMNKEEEQRACFHYTNMQPLWAEDNLKKSDSF